MPSVHDERRLITILFADLSGFTGLSSVIDPEDVREAANLCFSYLNTAILTQGGTIHKYEGDLVIALFGYPAAHEDDQERAIRAAFEMFKSLDSINRTLSFRLRVKTDLGLHVGINSGTVVVGEVGTPEKREVTVMGDVVNLASRLKDVAQRGEIVVSEPVFRASRYLFEYEALEPVAVKGIARPVKVFRPLKEKAKPEPKRGIHGLTSPLVGREKELATLRESIANLAGGGGGATWVLGEAGLGKSRLWEEARGSLPEGIRLLEGRCLTYGKNVPYWPFLQVLEGVFGISDQDSKESLQDKVLRKTKEVCPEDWAEVAPYLGQLFSVRFADELDEKVRHLDAQGLRTQIFLSLRELLAALSRMSSLLLVIEDYHWMDSESLEFLEFLFDSPEPLPILLLVLSRPEKGKRSHEIKERLKKRLGEHFREIILTPLDFSAGSRLVDNLLAAPGLPGDFRDQILAKAEGNPFYLEEILRSLIDSRVLVQRSGKWEVAQDGPAIAIPDTVQAVIATRIDGLEKDVREVLQIAAVIGRNFQVQVLGELCGLAGLMLTLYLAELEEHEYIREVTHDPVLEYTFHQPLVQEVAYNSLLKTRRRELHRRAGEVIEELYRDRPEDSTELLAYQYSRSDDPRKAVLWLFKAGQKAKEHYASEEAIAYFQEAVAILKDGRPGLEQELSRVWDALGEVYYLKGDYDRAKTCYRDAEQAVLQDPKARTRLRRNIAKVDQIQGRYQEALAFFDELDQALAKGSAEDKVDRVECFTTRCWIYSIQGDFRKAIAEGEAGLSLVESIEALNDPSLMPRKIEKARAQGYLTLGTAFSNNGETDRAIELFSKYLDLTRKLGDKELIGQACSHLGNEYYIKGDYERALAMYWEYLTLSREIGHKRGIAIASNNMGYVYAGLGQRDKALELYQLYITSSEEMGYARGIAIGCWNLGGLFLEAGELDKAAGFLERAEKVCQEIGDRPTLVGISLHLAELKRILSQRDGSSDREAWEVAERALRQAEALGSKELRGKSHLVYGKLHSAADDFTAAGDDLRRAILLFTDLGDRRLRADAFLEYARMLKRAEEKGVTQPDQAGEYFQKARLLYEELSLPHKVRECS